MIFLLLLAQVDASAIESKTREVEATSGIRIGAELGPFTPDIDAELDGKTPFKDVFGDKTPWLARFRAGYLWAQPFGRIGVSASGGWAKRSANALKEGGGTSGGKTSLRIYPVDLLLHLHGDAIADMIPVPLSPYAAAGFTYTFWQITKGDGTTATVDGSRASGGTPGYEIVAGASLLLHRIDRKAALAARDLFSIDGAELYAQFVHVGTLGKDRLRMGDQTWQLGLAVSF